VRFIALVVATFMALEM